jgi:hypothetical protein
MAWRRGRAARATTALIPVIGPRTTAQLGEYLDALDLDLTGEQHDRLDRAGAQPLGTPHETVAAGLPGALGGDTACLRRHPVPVVQRPAPGRGGSAATRRGAALSTIWFARWATTVYGSLNH